MEVIYPSQLTPDLSLRRGDFGEAWLAPVAAGRKFLHGKRTTADGGKADLELVFPVRYLRTRSPAHGTQVQGLVIRLTRDSASGPGEAVVEGVYDDSLSVGRVTVGLNGSDYEQAIWAHRLGRHVSMNGDLGTPGNRKYLESVSGFTILAREDV